MFPKYIILEGDIPIIFPGDLNHKDIANLSYGKMVLGAGKVDVCWDKTNPTKSPSITCFGESAILGIYSRKEQDAKIIERYLLPDLKGE
jgi:hypothetical protein